MKKKKAPKKKKKAAIRMKIPNLMNDQSKPKEQKPPVRKKKPKFKGTISQRLQQVADWEGVSVEYAAANAIVLKIAGLKKKQITKKVISEAGHIDRSEVENLKRKAWKLNGTWNRERSPEEEAKIKQKKEEERQTKKSTTTTQSQTPARRRGPKGQSNKDHIYQLWIKKKKTTPEELLKVTEATVLLSTVRNWTRVWKKGEGLPASASKKGRK